MIRVLLRGRPPRVMRLEELAASVWELDQQRPLEACSGSVRLEWLSPSGAVIADRACDSLRELVLLLPGFLGTAREGT